MSAPEFDPALVEKVRNILDGLRAEDVWGGLSGTDLTDAARAVLSAAAPILRAEGAQIVLDAVENRTVPPIAAAREAVARIEGRASP